MIQFVEGKKLVNSCKLYLWCSIQLGLKCSSHMETALFLICSRKALSTSLTFLISPRSSSLQFWLFTSPNAGSLNIPMPLCLLLVPQSGIQQFEPGISYKNLWKVIYFCSELQINNCQRGELNLSCAPSAAAPFDLWGWITYDNKALCVS